MCKILHPKKMTEERAESPGEKKAEPTAGEKAASSIKEKEGELREFIETELAERAKIDAIEKKVIKNIEAYDQAFDKQLNVMSKASEKRIAETEAKLQLALDKGNREETIALLKKMSEEQ